jgi:small subunit ribosomal protein S2
VGLDPKPPEVATLALITMKELLEAGVHFGHQTRRWNPKMKRYIYHERNGIYIIDLHQTLKLIEQCYEFVRDMSAKGGNLLFVGTKRQAAEAIEAASDRCGMPYVNKRWLGGMMTNFNTIQSRIKHLDELDMAEQGGEWSRLTKKEALMLSREREKLNNYLGGIRHMRDLPQAIFIVDLKREHIAAAEANKLKIPVVAIVDTNCDPDVVDYVVPGNDDAIRAIRLISGKMADAVLEGRGMYQQGLVESAANEQQLKDAVAEEQAAIAREAVVSETLSPEEAFIEVFEDTNE